MLREPAVRLPAWVVVLLITVLLSGLGGIYTAGQMTAKIDALKDAVQTMETRLERVEQYLQKK